MLNLLFIQMIIVFIVDISGFVDSVKVGISRLITKGKISKSDFRIKPFDCSLCTTFWVGLIYLLCVHQFSIPMIAFVCLLAATTGITKEIFYTLNDIVIKILRLINYEKTK